MDDLVKEAKGLAKNGTKELMLIAQDLSSYGIDLYEKRNLAELLKHLSDVEGIDWIRLHYAFPAQFPMDALDVMNERSNICKYIDIPLQHISDNVLKSMRRGITKKRTIELLDEFRNKVPNLAIRTTMLVGHPGETEKDFEELKEFIQKAMLDRIGVFTYSHEESTHAHTLVDDVPADIKQKRANELMDVQQDISYELNQKKVGKTLKVLFDRKENEHFIGRTEFDSPEVDNEVLADAKEQYVRVGDFANVLIEDADFYDLKGRIV
jgi:ribosomal protein S12 methylthiotransferase